MWLKSNEREMKNKQSEKITDRIWKEEEEKDFELMIFMRN